jgi:hypothetical protein
MHEFLCCSHLHDPHAEMIMCFAPCTPFCPLPLRQVMGHDLAPSKWTMQGYGSRDKHHQSMVHMCTMSHYFACRMITENFVCSVLTYHRADPSMMGHIDITTILLLRCCRSCR